jgi:hypothetical protein
MAARDAELVLETWKLRERLLPRVPPEGWGTTDRLRHAVCLAVVHAVDGVESVESFEGSATERERFQAAVSGDTIDDEHVTIVTPLGTENSASVEPPDETRETFDAETEQFDLDDALDRL